VLKGAYLALLQGAGRLALETLSPIKTPEANFILFNSGELYKKK
jgi:hypothetical protein